MKQLREFATLEALTQATATRIANALNLGLGERGEACAALSGGGTPEPSYRALAALPLDWPRITFLLVDERFVPPTHAASNENMLRRALAPALAAGAKLVAMFAAEATPEAAAQRADALYASIHIDIAVMGMGLDGHTASWFPQSPQLKTALDPIGARAVIAVHAPGAAGASERLTLTRAAISRAGAIVLVITGEVKRERLSGGGADTPVAALFELRAPTEIFWGP